MKFKINSVQILLVSLFTSFLFFSCEKECTEPKSPCSQETIRTLLGTWEGEFDQFNFGQYPMILEVEMIDECNFSGKHRWTTLQNSVTTMEGFMRNDTLFWTEPELLQGSNIVLNGNYVAVFSDENTLSGSWTYPNGGLGGTFAISK